jgi:hypothetical protein
MTIVIALETAIVVASELVIGTIQTGGDFSGRARALNNVFRVRQGDAVSSEIGWAVWSIE